MTKLSSEIVCYSSQHYGLAFLCILSSAILVFAGAVHKRIIYSQRLSFASPFPALTNSNGIIGHFCRSFLLVYQQYVPEVRLPSPTIL